jgi:hypothetical protein
MRARDVRAITFCAVSIAGLFVLLLLVTRNYLVTLGATAAFAALVLTRPRMLRVFARLRGAPDWSGYFENGGETRLSGRGPAARASPPRRAARR